MGMGARRSPTDNPTMSNIDIPHQLWLITPTQWVKVGEPRPLAQAMRLKAAHSKVRPGARTQLLPI